MGNNNQLHQYRLGADLMERRRSWVMWENETELLCVKTAVWHCTEVHQSKSASMQECAVGIFESLN